MTLTNSIKESITQLNNLLEALPLEVESLSTQLQRCDQEINDIKHYIEFNDFSEGTSQSIYLDLKKSLNSRRIIKNELSKLNGIKRIVGNHLLQPNSLDIILQSINQREEALSSENRIYEPRVREDLFKKEEIVL